MGKLEGKVALITGGTTGIGAAAARRFQGEGAVVVVTGSNPETLEAAREGMAGIEVVASDAADVAAIGALVDGVVARHGRIDVLFANAGIAKMGPSAAIDEALFDLEFGINVKGVFFLLKHAAPVMTDGGSIILTASVSAHMGGPGQTVYGATKAAVRSFGRTFAAELAPRGIRVNTISPGPIETPIFGKVGLSAEQLAGMTQEMLARIPLKRVGQADEIAAAALFLASGESSFVTGTELVVDGGMIGV